MQQITALFNEFCRTIISVVFLMVAPYIYISFVILKFVIAEENKLNENFNFSKHSIQTKPADKMEHIFFLKQKNNGTDLERIKGRGEKRMKDREAACGMVRAQSEML